MGNCCENEIRKNGLVGDKQTTTLRAESIENNTHGAVKALVVFS